MSQLHTQLPPSNPVPDSILRLIQTAVPPLTCLLCNQLYDRPHTFQSCGCTFCWRCVISTMEGKGISKSQCPACKMPAWKKDLRKNCTYETAIETIMKAKQLSQQAALSSRAQELSPSPRPGQDGSTPAPSSCALNYQTFHDLLAQLLISEFDQDKLQPLQDGFRSPFHMSLEKLAQLQPPVLSRAEEGRVKAELATLESWLDETDSLIESKEKIKMDADKRDAEMMHLLGGNSENAAQKPRVASSSPVRGIAFTCTDSSPDFKSKLDRLVQLLSPDGVSGGVKMSNDVNERTSHVIVGGLDENRLAKFRSRSFLLGILRGCWIVSTAWVDACLETGCLVDEADFEVQGDLHAKGGPEKGRRARIQGHPCQDMSSRSLFGSLSVCLIKSTWPNDQMKNYEAVEKVLLVGGATLRGEDERDAFLAVVFSTRGWNGTGSSISTDQDMGVTTVGYRWVFDCVSHYNLIEFAKYT